LNPTHKKWAAIYANGESICVQTCSGFRRSVADPGGGLFFLPGRPEVSELGNALNSALARSRMLAPEELGRFFDVAAVKARYEEWVATYMQKYGYASRRALFKDMKHCSVESAGGVVRFSPTVHEELEAWSGIEGEFTVPEPVSDQDLGQAAFRALEVCK